MIQQILVLLAFYVQHLTSERTCTEVTCHLNQTLVRNSINQGDITKACHLLNRTIVCQEEVIAQCQSNKKWRTLHLTSSQNSLLSRREEFQNNCHSEIMCADIGQCRIYMEKIAEAMEQDQVFEACGYLKANIQCLRLAVADCNREDSFDPVMLDNYTLTLKDSENKWQKDCDNVYIVQGSYVTGSHVYNMCTETSWSWCLVFVSLLVAGTFLECSLTFNKFFLVLS